MNFCDPICHNFLLALQSHPDLPETPTSLTRQYQTNPGSVWVGLLLNFIFLV